MIVDSSALVAIVRREPKYDRLLEALAREAAGIGAPTLVECGIVLTARLGTLGRTLLARLVREAGLDIVPFDEEHLPVALEAFDRYGKGRHPAALDFGDCLTYAIAKLADEPLLTTGADFSRTDLAIA